MTAAEPIRNIVTAGLRVFLLLESCDVMIWHFSGQQKLIRCREAAVAHVLRERPPARVSADIIVHPYESNTWFLVIDYTIPNRGGSICFEVFEARDTNIIGSLHCIVPLGLNSPRWSEIAADWESRTREVRKADAFGTYNIGNFTRMARISNDGWARYMPEVILFDTVQRKFTFAIFGGSFPGFDAAPVSGLVQNPPQYHQVWDHSAFCYERLPGNGPRSGCVTIHRSESHDPITLPSAGPLVPYGNVPIHIPVTHSRRRTHIVGDQDFIVVLRFDYFIALSLRSLIPDRHAASYEGTN